MNHLLQQPHFEEQAKEFKLNNDELLEVCVSVVSILQMWLHEKVNAQYCVTRQGKMRNIREDSGGGERRIGLRSPYDV